MLNVSLIERTRKNIQMCTIGKYARRDFLKPYEEDAHAQILSQPADPWQPAVRVCRCPVTGNPSFNGELWT